MGLDLPYRFRPVAAGDLDRLRAWRRRPHVAQWWGPAEIEDPAEVLGDARVRMWMVELDGMPFAYAQDYRPHDWTGHPFAHLPTDSRGIDQYIGEPDLVGLWHGSRFVRQALRSAVRGKRCCDRHRSGAGQCAGNQGL